MRNIHADPTANTAIANVDRERRREEARRRAAERHAEPPAPQTPPTKPRTSGWRLAWTDRQGRID